MNLIWNALLRAARALWEFVERHGWWLIGIGLTLLVLAVFTLAALIVFGEPA